MNCILTHTIPDIGVVSIAEVTSRGLVDTPIGADGVDARLSGARARVCPLLAFVDIWRVYNVDCNRYTILISNNSLV